MLDDFCFVGFGVDCCWFVFDYVVDLDGVVIFLWIGWVYVDVLCVFFDGWGLFVVVFVDFLYCFFGDYCQYCDWLFYCLCCGEIVGYLVVDYFWYGVVVILDQCFGVGLCVVDFVVMVWYCEYCVD